MFSFFILGQFLNTFILDHFGELRSNSMKKGVGELRNSYRKYFLEIMILSSTFYNNMPIKLKISVQEGSLWEGPWWTSLYHLSLYQILNTSWQPCWEEGHYCLHQYPALAKCYESPKSKVQLICGYENSLSFCKLYRRMLLFIYISTFVPNISFYGAKKKMIKEEFTRLGIGEE